MTDVEREETSAVFQAVLETVDGKVEDLAPSGDIAADARGDLSVDTLIARWRSVQSAAMDETGGVDPKTIC